MTRVLKQLEGMEEGFDSAVGIEGVEDTSRSILGIDMKPTEVGGMKGGI